ncbi:unnamed protein product [Lota lota]
MPNGPSTNRLSGHTEVGITKGGLGPHTAVQGYTEESREKQRNPGNGALSQCGHRNHVLFPRFRWHLPLSSTPIEGPGFRPSKRLCVEEEEGDTSTEFQAEPLDSSYNRGDYITEECEISFDPTSTYGDPKYTVFESCFRELFDTCSVCKTKCEVQRRQMGTYVAFNQHCRNCNYSRR